MDSIKPIKPIKLSTTTYKTETNEKLTSAEIGKLWITYMGNSMSKCVLSYFLQHMEDDEIKNVYEKALNLTDEFIQKIRKIYIQEHHPIPIGFTEEDVNLDAPRLFMDEFYLHYLKYVAKAGMSIYSIAISLMVRPDTRTFFTNALNSTINLMNEINELLMKKGLLVKSPYIPIPQEIDFVEKQSYLNGFFGNVRPLHAMEIAHLTDNIENNVTSGSVLVGFAQVAKLQQVREYFARGEKIALKHIQVYSQLLIKEDLPASPLLSDLVTDSTFAPFSDKLMLFHKLDMFSMRIRTYANSMAVNGRHDVGAKYALCTVDVAKYVEDGANIMIDMGWMEQLPQAVDREALALK